MDPVHDSYGSVLVRIRPREDAASDDLKTLAECLRRWLAPRQDVYGPDEGALAALEAGELPLPENLWLRNMFREHPGTCDDPEVERFIRGMQELSLADYARVFREGNRRVLAFRVYHVGFHVRKLYESLSHALHAPAVAGLEFRWEYLTSEGGIGEQGKCWEVGASPP
jgi:hypothetical protein